MRNNQQRNFGRNNKTNFKDKMPEKISVPLSKLYQDKTKIFLDTGIAYKTAEKMGDIPPHQLRKILNELKDAVALAHTDFEKARNKIYYIVPLTAYNFGRNKKIKDLYDFVYTHINENYITCEADIIVLDQLFTSIIAYHKCFKSL